LDANLFDDAPKGIRFQKPIQRKKIERNIVENKEINFTKKFKKVPENNPNVNLFDTEVTVGNIVEHNRFGKGEVLSLEGNGANKKAEIQFGTVGKKKLLLQFAKLKVIG
jgi:DNA helicase-2/ATP-dependent DNA helicase PcrA